MGHGVEGARNDGIVFVLGFRINAGQRPGTSRIAVVPDARCLFVGGTPVESEAQASDVLLRPWIRERAYGYDRVATEFVGAQLGADPYERSHTLPLQR
jgi:hypothetical protein